MNETVSLIIPAYNAAGTIRECLESVFSSDLKRCEVILVDDCSKDKTAEIAKEFPCRVLRNKKNSGAAAARNLGAKKASGKILLFVDSDETVQKDLLRRTLKVFQDYPQVSAFVGTFSKKHRHASFISQYKNLHFYYYATKVPFYTRVLNGAIAAVKKDAFWAVNGFDCGKKTIAEDADFGMRLSKAGFLICQRKDIEVEHLKLLSFKSFVKNDFERGSAITKSLFTLVWGRQQKRQGKGKAFSLSDFLELYLSIPLPLMILVLIAFGFAAKWLFFVAAALLLAFVFLNRGFWVFLAKEKGIYFALFSAIVTFFEMVVIFSGILTGFASALKEEMLSK